MTVNTDTKAAAGPDLAARILHAARHDGAQTAPVPVEQLLARLRTEREGRPAPSTPTFWARWHVIALGCALAFLLSFVGALGALQGYERGQVHGHVRSCTSCHAYLQGGRIAQAAP
jgi:hypothetical protein